MAAQPDTSLMWFLSFAGGGFHLASLIWALRNVVFLRSARRTEGEVVDIDDRSSSEFLVVTFTLPNAQSVTFRSNVTAFGRWSVGERVGVLYGPDNHKRAYVATFMQFWGGPVITLIVGGVFWAILWGSMHL